MQCSYLCKNHVFAHSGMKQESTRTLVAFEMGNLSGWGQRLGPFASSDFLPCEDITYSK